MVETSAAIPGSLVWGHACLAACAALDLAWWWTFFNPSLPKATGALYATGVGFIVGAVILGIAVVALIVAGLAGLRRRRTRRFAGSGLGVRRRRDLRVFRARFRHDEDLRQARHHGSFCCSCCGRRSSSPC